MTVDVDFVRVRQPPPWIIRNLESSRVQRILRTMVSVTCGVGTHPCGGCTPEMPENLLRLDLEAFLITVPPHIRGIGKANRLGMFSQKIRKINGGSLRDVLEKVKCGAEARQPMFTP